MADPKPSDDDLRALLAAEKLATEGPWLKMLGTNLGYIAIGCGHGPFLADAPMGEPDVDLVIAARRLAAPMATELLALRAEVERLRPLDAVACDIMRECNEASECPLCGDDGAANFGEHEEWALCATLDAVLNPRPTDGGTSG